MKRLINWLRALKGPLGAGKRQPRMTLDQILDYNLAAGRLVVGW